MKFTAINCLILALLITCSAHAENINESYNKVGQGLYQKVYEDGTVVQIATSDVGRGLLDKLSFTQATHRFDSKNNSVSDKSATAWDSTVGEEFCAPTNLFPEQMRQFEINGTTATISGKSFVGSFAGPWPPQPIFTYTRSKTRLKTYFADQTIMAITANTGRHYADQNSTPVLYNHEPDVYIGYSLAESTTSIDLTGASYVKWIVRTEHLVDNPPAPPTNCFEHVTIRTVSPLIPVN